MFKRVAKLFKRASDSYDVLDFRECGLQFVPPEPFQPPYQTILERLYLDSNQIRDLPKTLFSLSTLKKLTISDNELSELPSHIANLTTLKELDISKNGISEIPDSVKCCKALVILDASVNPLKRLSDGFTQLLNLTELYLNDAYLEYLPANFGRLSNLRVLELRQNNLKTLPKSIGRLVELQHLDIGNNEFDDLPEEIGLFVNLTELWVDYNNLRTLPVSIRRLRKLEYLDAHYNAMEWLPEELAELENITYLDLSCNFLLELIENIGNLRRLETLRLDENEIEYLPLSIGGLESLSELSVSGNELEELPTTIGYLKKLRTFNADENYLFFLPSELGNCSALSILSLRCNHLERIPDEIGRLIRLKVLNLSENRLQNLPYTFSNLITQLSALWLSENQSKPLYPLQTDFDPETKMRVLTCFLMPQPTYSSEEGSSPSYYSEEGSLHSFNRAWEEQPIDYNRQNRIAFNVSDTNDTDEHARQRRAPYPKDAKTNPMQERHLMARQVLDKDQHRKRLEQRQHDYSDGSASSPRHYARHQPRSADNRRPHPHHRDDYRKGYGNKAGEYDAYSNGNYDEDVYHQHRGANVPLRYDSRNHHVTRGGGYDIQDEHRRSIENGQMVQRYQYSQEDRTEVLTSPNRHERTPDNDFRDGYPGAPNRRIRGAVDAPEMHNSKMLHNNQYRRRTEDHVDRVRINNRDDSYNHQNLDVMNQRERARHSSPVKHSQKRVDINDRSYVQPADRYNQNTYQEEVISNEKIKYADYTDGPNSGRQANNINAPVPSLEHRHSSEKLNLERTHGSMSNIINKLNEHSTENGLRYPDNRSKTFIDNNEITRPRYTQHGIFYRSMTDITDHSGYTSPSNDKRRRVLADVTDMKRSLTASDVRYSTSNLYEGIASFASPDTASGKDSNYWWARRTGEALDITSAEHVADEKGMSTHLAHNAIRQRGSNKNINDAQNINVSTNMTDQHPNAPVSKHSMQENLTRSNHFLNAPQDDSQELHVKPDLQLVDTGNESKHKRIKSGNAVSREQLQVPGGDSFDENKQQVEIRAQDRPALETNAPPQQSTQTPSSAVKHGNRYEQLKSKQKEKDDSIQPAEVANAQNKVTKERGKSRPARKNRQLAGYFHEDYDAEKEARILAWRANVEPGAVADEDSTDGQDHTKSTPMESAAGLPNVTPRSQSRNKRSKGENRKATDGENNKRIIHASVNQNISVIVEAGQLDNGITNELARDNQSNDAKGARISRVNVTKRRAYLTPVQHGGKKVNETNEINHTGTSSNQLPPGTTNEDSQARRKQPQKVNHRKHREKQAVEDPKRNTDQERNIDPVESEDSGFRFNVENLDDSESSKSLKVWVREKMQVERDYAKANNLDDLRKYIYFPDSSDVEEQFYREQRRAAKRPPSSEGRSQASGPARKPIVRPIESMLNSTLQQTFRVQIEKNPGLGFSVSGGIGSPGNPYKPTDRGGIYVTRVLPNGAAATGVIPGDKILQVNSRDLVDVTHPEAVATLKNATNPVELIIVRDYGQSL